LDPDAACDGECGQSRDGDFTKKSRLDGRCSEERCRPIGSTSPYIALPVARFFAQFGLVWIICGKFSIVRVACCVCIDVHIEIW